MKKAKILLSAIAVFAIVGSAVAFKSNKGFTPYYTCNLSDVCVQAPVTPLLVSATEQPTFIPVSPATLDAQSVGLACENANHPCTSTIWTLGAE